MKYAAMSPMERMRENILQGMGISDDQLKAMPPDQQKVVEEKIKEQIEKETGANGNKSGQLIGVSLVGYGSLNVDWFWCRCGRPWKLFLRFVGSSPNWFGRTDQDRELCDRRTRLRGRWADLRHSG